MKKKKRLLPVALASLMVMSIYASPVKANENLIIANPSFEEEIKKEDIQLYKAKRTNEKAYDGEYSIKVGTEKPENKDDVPMWQYNQGKGGMNVIVRNAEPNTKYTVKLRVLNTTGVRFQTGLVDIEGSFDTPWNISTPTYENATKSEEWKEVSNTITTGPRTNEFYIFAYCMNQKNGKDSGAFYIDNIEIEKGETVTPAVTSSIDYNSSDINKFPATIPAIQSFEKADGKDFRLNQTNQIFSTDEFSKEKTEYLAESMVSKGIIKDYTINIVNDAANGEGIVVVKEPINFTLPEADVIYSEADSYQIDITEDKAIIYSDHLEGIQNGTMTLLQAFVQRSQIPTGTVKDYTDQRVRGFQIDTARTFFSVEWLKEQMEQMAYYKQNKLQIRLKDSEGIRWQSEVMPELMDKDGYYYTQEDADELVAFAEKFNIEIIPEVDYPGHSEMEVDMYVNAGKKDWVLGDGYQDYGISALLNFTNDDVRKYVLDVYEEAAEFFHAKTIHIGGDEYFDIGISSVGSSVAKWANGVLGTTNSNQYDGMKLFFNEVAETMFDKGINVIMWNDNVRLGGNVELDKRIVVDFWAGNWKGSAKGSTASEAGYNVMSSSSTNYHNLWYQPRKESVRNPFPKEMYEKFTRFNYSVQSSTYEQDEILSTNKDKSLGQMFPIWSDILGGVSEPVLTRTVFPRYATFSYITWGAQCDGEKPMNYEEFERLMFMLGSPREEIKTNVKINYNKNDLDLVVNEIETALIDIEGIQANIKALSEKIDDIKTNYESYAVNGFYTEIINEIIHDFENVKFIAEETVEVNKDSLNIAIDEALKISDEELTNVVPAVVNEFKAALASAQEISTSTSASQQDVNDAFDRLANAMHMLSFIKGDKTDLEGLVIKITQLNANDYLTNTWDAMVPVLEEAKNVITNENALEYEVQESYEKLLRAFLELRLKPNKDLLNELINKAEALESTNYVSETWAPFALALANAKDTATNELATTAEIETAYDKLNSAINNLIEVTPVDQNTAVSMPKADTEIPEKESSLKTGDEINLGYFTVIGAVAILNVIGLSKKRKLD